MIGRRQDAPAGGCATETGMDGAAPLVYWIDRRDVITEVGGAWLAFALANGAPELDSASVVGRRLWDFVGDPTTGQLYRGILARARAGRAARFPFRCDAPASRRLLEMAVTAEGGGGVRGRGAVRDAYPGGGVPPAGGALGGGGRALRGPAPGVRLVQAGGRGRLGRGRGGRGPPAPVRARPPAGADARHL